MKISNELPVKGYRTCCGTSRLTREEKGENKNDSADYKDDAVANPNSLYIVLVNREVTCSSIIAL